MPSASTTRRTGGDEFEFTLDGPGGFGIDVPVEAESEADALATLAEWTWYEVGVEDTSGAWDHATVAAPNAEVAEVRGVEKAEAKAFNKVDDGHAYDVTSLGRIEQLNDDWESVDETWGEDFIVVLQADGTESLAATGIRTATKAVFDRLTSENSSFSVANRPDDPSTIETEAEHQVAWTAESEWTGAVSRVALTLSGSTSLVDEEGPTLADTISGELSEQWTRVDEQEDA
ncbi:MULTISPECIES: hypothetical protein [Halorussus]|uniref:hypothetical protein n=1 Tax=Halorussus TaxID=1070314 RepID=UPI0020A1E1D0|nr:hypothetical protein [Halorussus vallis]USZ78727.1 hypothetical protein NGM07_24765 [Halorussus vallis]